MYTLSLEVVNKCNLNCTYCYLGEKKNSYMSMDTAQKAVEIGIHEAKKQYDKTLIVYFIGGEPLLAFDIIKEIVFYVKARCTKNCLNYIFSITTNGVLITKDIVNFFIENKFQIKISLDGEMKIHDLNRKDYSGKGSFNVIVDNLNLLNNYQVYTEKPISFAHVVTQNNYKYFSESYQYLLDLGCVSIETGIDHYCEWRQEELEELRNQIVKVFYIYKNHIQKTQKWLNWNILEKHLKLYIVKCDFYACKAGINKIFVASDGNIYTCVELPEFLIGNVQNGLVVSRIREIAYTRDIVNEKCNDCKYLKNCATRGCQAANYEIHKNVYRPVEVECLLTKTIFKLIEKNIDEEQITNMRKEYQRRKIETEK